MAGLVRNCTGKKIDHGGAEGQRDRGAEGQRGRGTEGQRGRGTEETKFAAWITAYTITRRSCAERSSLIERCACSTNWNPSCTFQFETFFFPISQALTTLKLKITGVVFITGSLAALRLFRVTDSDSRCVFM